MNKILIVGSGGREHALAWKLKQSPKVSKIYIAPGNAGTAQVGENITIVATDIFGLADFAEKSSIDLTVVGQDDPLALGIVDEFQKRGLKIWGPTKKAAQIESSKVFAKELMLEKNIPTAEFKTFSDYNRAWEYAQKKGAPIVIKASGLALGKGVIVCKTLEEAEKGLREIMIDKIFGESGKEVVVEEFLQGMEFSTHAFCYRRGFVLLPPSQDHKPVFDGDKGPNTGGMGTIAPVPWVDKNLMDKVGREIVLPAWEGLRDMGAEFTGLLYPGLMMTEQGPKVIEFNARFGDPECQSYMRLLKTDLFDILEGSINGNLDEINIEWHPGFACCIALASGGYPGKYEKGFEITGIEEAEKMDNVIVFHAGTIIHPPSPPLNKGGIKGGLVTNGGRVLGV